MTSKPDTGPRQDNSLPTVRRNTSGLLRGGPGRTAGVPNKVTIEAKAICSRMVDDPVYLERLFVRLKSGRCAPAIEALIWHYAKGKPKETVEVSGVDGTALSQIVRIIVDPTGEADTA